MAVDIDCLDGLPLQIPVLVSHPLYSITPFISSPPVAALQVLGKSKDRKMHDLQIFRD